MEEQNLIVVKAGKRKFEALKSEQAAVCVFLGDDTESKEVELPALANVPEMVWRKVFPPTPSLPYSMMYDYLHTLMYFGFSLKPWIEEFANMAHDGVPSVSEIMDAVRCFELFLTTKPSRSQSQPVKLAVSDFMYWTDKLHCASAVFQLYEEIGKQVPTSTMVHVLPLIYPSMEREGTSLPKFFPVGTDGMFRIDVKDLLDIHTFLPFQQLFSADDLFHPFARTAIEPLLPLESGPVQLAEFRQRFDHLSHGLCDFPAIRSLIREGILVITGGAVAYCLSSRFGEPARSFQGRDIDLFVLSQPTEVQSTYQRMVLALKDFISERMPGKRVYWKRKCDAVVDIMVDDLDFTFQIIMTGHPNAAQLISKFDMSARKVLYNGERVLATLDGLFAWMTGVSYISATAKGLRLCKLRDAGFCSVTEFADVDKLNKRWKLWKPASMPKYFKPLSILPLDYNVRLLTTDQSPGAQGLVTEFSEVCAWKMNVTNLLVY
mgnify:CR=1 FL=1